MKELVRANDPVLISFVTALLNDAGIEHVVLDQNMSIMEGSIGAIPRRVLVAEDDLAAARRVLEAAEIGHEIRVEGTRGG